MSYTVAALIGAAAAAGIDVAVLRTRLLARKLFWVAYAIVLFFQLIVNGILAAQQVVRYNASAIVGWRIAYEPVEDLLFGFALVLISLSVWVWLGRRGIDR